MRDDDRFIVPVCAISTLVALDKETLTPITVTVSLNKAKSEQT